MLNPSQFETIAEALATRAFIRSGNHLAIVRLGDHHRVVIVTNGNGRITVAARVRQAKGLGEPTDRFGEPPGMPSAHLEAGNGGTWTKAALATMLPPLIEAVANALTSVPGPAVSFVTVPTDLPANVLVVELDRPEPKKKAAAPVRAGLDSQPRGTVDLWPFLRDISEPALVAAIGSGRTDPFLSELRDMESGHDSRSAVLEACQQRLRRLAA